MRTRNTRDDDTITLTQPTLGDDTAEVAQTILGRRVAALRNALRLTQAQAAARTNGMVSTYQWNRVETGLNKGSSDRVQSGIPLAFGLTRDEWQAYAAGEATLDDTLRLARTALRGTRGSGEHPAVRAAGGDPGDQAEPPPTSPHALPSDALRRLTESLGRVYDQRRGHTIPDVDTVRELFAGPLGAALVAAEPDLDVIASTLLDTVAEVRRSGAPPVPEAIVLRLARSILRPDEPSS